MNSSKICWWLVSCEGQRHAPGLRPAHPVWGNYQISAMSQCHTWVMWSHRGQGHSYCKKCNAARPLALLKWASKAWVKKFQSFVVVFPYCEDDQRLKLFDSILILKKLAALRNISGTTLLTRSNFSVPCLAQNISLKRCWQQKRFLFFWKIWENMLIVVGAGVMFHRVVATHYIVSLQ